MNAQQLTIFSQPKVLDFTNVLHTRENNAKSQEHLEKNKFHFTGQVAVVYSLLLKGIRLTSFDAMTKYGIGHLGRRICDLRDPRKGNVDVKGIFPLDENGKKKKYMEYYLELK